jgi:hypothetical protein
MLISLEHLGQSIVNLDIQNAVNCRDPDANCQRETCLISKSKLVFPKSHL